MKTITAFLLLAISINGVAQNIPEIFLPEIFNEFPNVRDISISNTQDELYFTVEGYKKEFSFIAVSKKENGVWTKPEVASFSGKNKDLEPFLSPDNLKLYFVSNRSIDSEIPKKDMDIWVVERKTVISKWSKPTNIGAPINTDKDEFYPSVTNSGNIYFTTSIDSDTKGKEDIYISKFVNGKYTKPKSLSDAVNSKTYEFNAYVSPDETIILFSSYRRADSFGGTDLYISTKDKNGNWKPSKNLGKEINSDKMDYCPFIDFNTNSFYFTSEKSIQKTHFKEQKKIDPILNEMNSLPNGLSRIYIINNLKIISY